MRCTGISSRVTFVPLVFLLLAACTAPPTHNQVTSQAIKRNCEAQGEFAANEVRKQSAQVVKEGGATDQGHKGDIEAQAQKAKTDAFKGCMLKYAV